MFNCFVDLSDCLSSTCTILHFYQQCMSSNFSTFLLMLIIIFLFDIVILVDVK